MKNKILKIVLVILLMIACGFGGWFLGAKVFDVEDKALNKKDNVKEKVEKKTEVEETTQDTKQATQILNTDVGTFIVDKNGSVYYEKADKFNSYEIKIDSNTNIGTYGTYEVEDYIAGLGYDETSKKTTEDHKFEGYKLDLENINSVYEIYLGNGGANDQIHLLSNDGKVNVLSFVANGEQLDITLSKDTCTKPNIVSVLQSSGFGAFEVIFVDKDGNKYTGTELAEENKR